MRASGRSTLLTTRITGSRASSALRRTKRVCGIGPSEASTSSRIPSTIVSAALDLAAEVGVAGRVDDVELDVAVADGGVLGEDRDPLLALEVHRVHHPLGDVGALAKGARLPQHRVERRQLRRRRMRPSRSRSPVSSDPRRPAAASEASARASRRARRSRGDPSAIARTLRASARSRSPSAEPATCGARAPGSCPNPAWAAEAPRYTGLSPSSTTGGSNPAAPRAEEVD